MTTGEKLTKLRKENNMTQEQLADILGVSRQSISKWESDAAYPETDKLVKLGTLYGCSMDYLLKDGFDEDGKTETASADAGNASENALAPFLRWHFERKSKKEYHGIPLWHINIGLGRKAKGIFAVGFSAQGVFALGLLSVGVFSAGVLSIGVVALGVLALGILALGALAAGIVAVGALCFGIFAVGAAAIGDFSIGALAVGKYFALGDHAYGAVAIGKTLADGTVTAPSLASADPDAVFRLLDEKVPTVLGGFKELVKRLF